MVVSLGRYVHIHNWRLLAGNVGRYLGRKWLYFDRRVNGDIYVFQCFYIIYDIYCWTSHCSQHVSLLRAVAVDIYIAIVSNLWLSNYYCTYLRVEVLAFFMATTTTINFNDRVAANWTATTKRYHTTTRTVYLGNSSVVGYFSTTLSSKMVLARSRHYCTRPLYRIFMAINLFFGRTLIGRRVVQCECR